MKSLESVIKMSKHGKRWERAAKINNQWPKLKKCAESMIKCFKDKCCESVTKVEKVLQKLREYENVWELPLCWVSMWWWFQSSESMFIVKEVP